MEEARNERRTSICCFNGYYCKTWSGEIQPKNIKVERFKKENLRDHMTYRIDFEYV